MAGEQSMLQIEHDILITSITDENLPCWWFFGFHESKSCEDSGPHLLVCTHGHSLGCA